MNWGVVKALLLDAQEALASKSAELEEIKNRDEYKINQELEEEIKQINETYKLAVTVYEDLEKYKEESEDTDQLVKEFVKDWWCWRTGIMRMRGVSLSMWRGR